MGQSMLRMGRASDNAWNKHRLGALNKRTPNKSLRAIMSKRHGGLNPGEPIS